VEELLRKKLLYILHRGLIECRLLAMSPQKDSQIHDLADALENIPNLMIAWNDSFLAGVERELSTRKTQLSGAAEVRTPGLTPFGTYRTVSARTSRAIRKAFTIRRFWTGMKSPKISSFVVQPAKGIL
jgi:hypothetical protein